MKKVSKMAGKGQLRSAKVTFYKQNINISNLKIIEIQSLTHSRLKTQKCVGSALKGTFFLISKILKSKFCSDKKKKAR